MSIGKILKGLTKAATAKGLALDGMAAKRGIAYLPKSGPPVVLAPEASQKSPSQLANMVNGLKLNPAKPEHQTVFSQIGRLDVQASASTRVMTSTIVKASTRDPQHYTKEVKGMLEVVQETKVPELREYFHKIQQNHRKYAYEIAEALLEGRASPRPQLANNPVMKRVSEMIKSKDLPPSEENIELVADIFTDVSAWFEYDQVEKQVVDSVIKDYIDDGKLEPLPVHPVEESRKISFAGHAGSGKGSLIKKAIRSGDLDLSQVARLTHDDYHQAFTEVLSLSRPESMSESEFSDFLHTAVGNLVIAPAEQQLRELQKKGISPHVLHEFIVVTEPRMESSQQVVFHVTCHSDISKVIKGAEERAKNTGRAVDKDYIINGQRGVSVTMPGAFAAVLGRANVRIEIHNTDHIHDKNLKEPEVPVAVCDSKSGKAILYSIDHMVHLNEKQDISDSAVTTPRTNEEMVQRFFSDYHSVVPSMVFVDPDMTAQQAEEVDNHVYAYVEEGKLIVQDEAVFQRVCNKSLLTATFFQGLQENLQLQKQATPEPGISK